MTAYVVLAYPDHLAAYADGATYDDAGIYRAPKQKVDVFTHLNVMVATRGNGAMGEILKLKLSYYQSFSDLKVMLPTELLGAAVECWAQGQEVNLEVILAGLPDYEGPPEIYTIFIAGDSPFDRQEGSLELKQAGAFYATPGLSQEEYEAAGLPAKETCGTAEEFYAAYMQAMRDIPRKMHRGGDVVGCNVGGFIMKTVLGRGEAATRIIHRWPDVIGQPLNADQKDEAA